MRARRAPFGLGEGGIQPFLIRIDPLFFSFAITIKQGKADDITGHARFRMFLAFIAMRFIALAIWIGSFDGAVGSHSWGRLSANHLVALKPLIIPMTPKADERGQFTLMIALEFAD